MSNKTMAKNNNAGGEKVKTNVPSGKFEGTYTHYLRMADGTLTLVGEVAYRHDVEPAADFDTVLRTCLGYDKREAEAARTAACEMAAAFETLVDNACETEG